MRVEAFSHFHRLQRHVRRGRDDFCAGKSFSQKQERFLAVSASGNPQDFGGNGGRTAETATTQIENLSHGTRQRRDFPVHRVVKKVAKLLLGEALPDETFPVSCKIAGLFATRNAILRGHIHDMALGTLRDLPSRKVFDGLLPPTEPVICSAL